MTAARTMICTPDRAWCSDAGLSVSHEDCGLMVSWQHILAYAIAVANAVVTLIPAQYVVWLPTPMSSCFRER